MSKKNVENGASVIEITESKKTEKSSETKKSVKKLSEKNLAVVITAAILAVVIIATGLIFMINWIRKDGGFDYMKSDLSKYVELAKEYKDFEISIDIAKPKEIEIDVAILSLLRGDKSEKANYGGSLITSPHKIGPGDVVHIWYRGYLLGEDGEQISLGGMTNFTGSTPAELEIGSTNFILGFEYNLVGKSTGDSAKFEKITEGRPTEEQVAYVSFTRITEKDEKTKTTQANVRIDLSRDDIDEEFGKGVKERILLSLIGSSKIDFGAENSEGKTYNYTDFKVDYVTECEKNPLVIEAYFPYDYSTAELRNETAYFEVYFDGMVDFDAPEVFDDEYLKKKIEDKKINISIETLNEYEGATLVEKYRNYGKKALNDIYEEEYNEKVESAIWDYLNKNSKGLKYPEIKVEEIYNEYLSDIQKQFDSSGGQVYNQYTGSSSTYQTLDTYAPAYLGLSSSADWRAYIVSLAQNLVKERMILYYLIQKENLVPNADVLKKEIEDTKQEYLDEYIQQYLDYEKKTKDDYTAEEYAAFVEARRGEIFSYYDDAHFTETAHYNIAMETIMTWPKVKTLDDRRAYPVEK